jgi:hypothetical protein
MDRSWIKQKSKSQAPWFLVFSGWRAKLEPSPNGKKPTRHSELDSESI